MTRKNNFLTYWLPLTIILVGAALLRAIGVRWGLPMAFHNDEPVLVLASQQFFTGDFNPHNFLYPSLLMYIMHVVHRIYSLFIHGVPDLSSLYILSRLTVGAFGVSTVYLTVVLGKKLFGRYVGLGAGLVLALCQSHVVNSHFATTDVPLAFFFLLTLHFAINLGEKGRMRDYLLTGLFFGLTVSIKIPGAVILVPIVIAHLYNVKQKYQLNYRTTLQPHFVRFRFHVINVSIALLGGSIVYLLFHYFGRIASLILSIIEIEFWERFYDEIVQHASLLAFKYGFIVFGGALLTLTFIPVLKIKVKNLIYLVAVAVGAFFATTPYALLDIKTFVKDFLFQLVISQTSWGGQFFNSPPAYITHFLGLLNDFGAVLMLLSFIGVVGMVVRRRIAFLLVLSAAFTYYAYIGTWKIMFGRYIVPILPFIALFAVAGLAYVREFLFLKFEKQGKYARLGIQIVVILSFALPSVRLAINSINYDRYLLKKSTKTIAYEWALENIPRDAKVLREQYAPELEIAGYNVRNVNFTFNDSVNVDFIKKNHFDYIIVTDKIWSRKALENGVLKERRAYQKIPEYADLIYHIKPTKPHPGPEIKIYRTRLEHAGGEGEKVSIENTVEKNSRRQTER